MVGIPTIIMVNLLLSRACSWGVLLRAFRSLVPILIKGRFSLLLSMVTMQRRLLVLILPSMVPFRASWLGQRLRTMLVRHARPLILTLLVGLPYITTSFNLLMPPSRP